MRLTAINSFYLGWTMVFKAVGGVERNVYEFYKSDQTSSEVEEKALDITNKHRDHYKNRIVLAWEAFAASEVLSHIATAGGGEGGVSYKVGVQSSCQYDVTSHVSDFQRDEETDTIF